jgi:hypothetical protein
MPVAQTDITHFTGVSIGGAHRVSRLALSFNDKQG